MQVPPFKQALSSLMPYVDYLFGNEAEALEFAKSEEWSSTDIPEIARKASGSFIWLLRSDCLWSLD